MSGKLISLVIAAAVAVTGLTAAPAQAGDRDVARALAAIAGIAIVGAVIHDANKDKRRAAPRRNLRPAYGAHRPHRGVKRHHRQQAIADRAYRQGYQDHRHAVRERRAERRDHRRMHRGGHRAPHGYSARPRRYAH